MDQRGHFNGAMEGQGKVQKASAHECNCVRVHGTARHRHSTTVDGEPSALHTQEHHRSFHWSDGGGIVAFEGQRARTSCPPNVSSVIEV